MSVESPGKPKIYWVAAPNLAPGEKEKLPREKREIPENAVVCLWDAKERCYIETWIDKKTGHVRRMKGGI